MINWDEVWATLEKWIVQDRTEGRNPDVVTYRTYIQWIVEKQLRRNNERGS